jgi:hypothetical protein
VNELLSQVMNDATVFCLSKGIQEVHMLGISLLRNPLTSE